MAASQRLHLYVLDLCERLWSFVTSRRSVLVLVRRQEELRLGNRIGAWSVDPDHR